MRSRWLPLVMSAALVGCSWLGGGGKDKSSALPSEFGSPEHARVDPDYRYKRAFLVWQANHDSIVEGMDSGSTLQINEAYKAVKDALATMRRYIAQGPKETLDGHLAEYEKVMGYVSRGNYNTAVHSMLAGLKRKVENSLSPELVATVVPEGEAFAAAPAEPRPEPAPKTMESVSPELGAPTMGAAYRQSWEAWQRLSADLMERLYSTSPRVDDLHPQVLAALDAMAPSLPPNLKEALAQVRSQYDALLMKVQTKGVGADTVEQVARIQRLMESEFAPEKVAVAQPKAGPAMGAPKK